ncbi:interferon-induced protein with tetratricopeptide repeats 2-like [Sparus aurata]|uniref:Interferon-induced protein with tetratricopeptide repeats 2-like n=1 Tax=Sparus aurata TaxID=8175 RepID=A0A671VS69_SPAAU|nr:interferon-induced protein with tetratricopeptide repeats 2-like [Sparus aurata]
MMSQTSLESKLEALQCHFTWDLDPSRSRLFFVRYQMEDIGTEEGNSWLGHIYNLRGYVQHKLGFTQDAQSLFNKAAEAFCQTRRADSDEGPWLVVNYGNLAWLHHHLGEQAESQAYLSKVDALMNKYPSPSQDELHPEIYAEKAWTLMNFKTDRKQLAADYFQRAIRMQPDMVEWKTSHVLLLAEAAVKTKTGLDADMLERMRIAKEEDPENLYLAAYYLQQNAKMMKKERVEDEARELVEKILRNPVSSYNGLRILILVYIRRVSVDEAIDLAEEALRRHPDVRFLRRCAALCYRSKIYSGEDGSRDQSTIDKAISLHEEVVSLYPHSCLLRKIDLANLYAKSNHGQAEAQQIYQEVLESDLDPADKQLVYNRFANYLFFDLHDRHRSIKYHMRAAEIPIQSFFRQNSIMNLEKFRDRNWRQMSREIEEFLRNLPEPEM